MKVDFEYEYTNRNIPQEKSKIVLDEDSIISARKAVSAAEVSGLGITIFSYSDTMKRPEDENFDRLPLERKRQVLRNPPFLPTVAQILSAFPNVGNDDKAEMQQKNLWDDFCAKAGFIDVLNREYVDTLAGYLSGRAIELETAAKRPTIVLEVEAGYGRLAYFLRQRLDTNLVEYYATSTSDSFCPIQHQPIVEAEVEEIHYQDAVEKYKPDIVICEWMPNGKDWTETFRKAGVKEYILIGKVGGSCGHPWLTWGGHEFSELHRDDIPPYEGDKYKKIFLSFDSDKDEWKLGWVLACRNDFLPYNPIKSQTVSFSRVRE